MRYYLDLLLERPPAQRMLFLLATALLLGASDYFLVHRPFADRIARTTAQLDLARLDEARLRRELSRLPQLREELAGLRRELQSRVPRVGEPSTLLESVTARAALSRLEVVRFHPGAPVDREHFTEIPVKVELKGSFHDLLKFLERSAGSRRLPSPRDLVIETLDAENGHTNGHTVLLIALDMAMLRLPAVEETGDTATPADDGQTVSRRDVGESPVEPLPAETLPLPPRDPFQPYRVPVDPGPDGPPEQEAAPLLPPEPAAATRFHAVGIVWQQRFAAALVRDAEGRSHVVEPGARLDGHPIRVKAVTPCEVVLETARPGGEPGETRLAVPRCRLPPARRRAVDGPERRHTPFADGIGPA